MQLRTVPMRVVVAVAASLVAAFAVAGVATAGTGISGAAATVTASAEPATGPSGEPSDTPTDPQCQECECEDGSPNPTGEPTADPTIGPSIGATAGAGTYHSVALRAPLAGTVKVTFTVSTDKDKGVQKLDPTKDVKVADEYYREYITDENVQDDPHGCYKLRFERRRMTSCDQVTVTAIDGKKNPTPADATVQDPDVIPEPDGSKRTRYFFTFGKKYANATFTITVTCKLK